MCLKKQYIKNKSHIHDILRVWVESVVLNSLF